MSNINNEMEAVVGTQIGRQVSFPVAASDIRRWAIAVYWPEPPPRLFWDEAHAKSTVHEGIVAPEEFNPFAWMAAEQSGLVPALSDDDSNDPNRLEKSLGIQGPGLRFQLNGGLECEYGVRVRPGDVITSTTHLADYYEREGRLGLMLFTISESTWTNQREQLVKRTRRTSIRYGEAPAPAQHEAVIHHHSRHTSESAASISSASQNRGDPMPETIDVRTIRVGDLLRPFQRTTGFHNWNRYAAVNDEFVPIHMDDEAGRTAGYPSAFGMGNLQISYLHNLIRRWMGDGGGIAAFGCQLRSANVKGQTVTARGRVTTVREEGGEQLVDLEVWTEQQDRVKLAPGHATIALRLDSAT